ncbi:MAG: CHAT domain-containing protein [Symploca sp. SIO1A3]|nr:CHAT domain-containing protein [Symploca sp. SIO1A3]
MKLKKFFFIALASITLQFCPISFLAFLTSSPAIADSIAPRQKTEADKLMEQGKELYDSGQRTEALKKWEVALGLYRQIGDIQGEAEALGNMGHSYRELGNYVKAIDAYNSSLAMFERIAESGWETNANGSVYYKTTITGQENLIVASNGSGLTVKIASTPNGQSIAVSNVGGGSTSTNQVSAIVSSNVGGGSTSTNQVSAIVSSDARGVSTSTNQVSAIVSSNVGGGSTSTNQVSAIVSSNAGGVSTYTNQVSAIVSSYAGGASSSRQISVGIVSNSSAQADILANLGIVYGKLGNTRAAIDSFSRSLSIAEGGNNPIDVANILGYTSIVYNNLGDYQEVIKLQERQLDIVKGKNNRPGEAEVLVGKGDTYTKIGDYQKAIKNYQQSSRIYEQLKDDAGKAETLGKLGRVYHLLGEISQARDYYHKQLNIAHEIKRPRLLANALGGNGDISLSSGEYQTAFNYYSQQLEIAKVINEVKEITNSLINLGKVSHKMKKTEEAIEYYQTALNYLQNREYPYEEATALSNLGKALLEQGNLLEAEASLRDAIGIWEDFRKLLGSKDNWKISLFEKQVNTYNVLQEVLVDQNKPFEALEIAERGRTRALIELLLKGLSPAQQESAIADYSKLSEIKQIAAQQKATLVEYSLISENLLYIWVIQPTGKMEFRSVDIPQNAPISELVTASRRFISARSRNDNNPTSDATTEPSHRLQQLHQLLIEPIAELLPSDANERVVFIPHHELFLVPFAALQDTNYKYLIEKHTILTAPSIQSLALTRQHRLRVQNLSGEALVAGNPTMPELVLGPNRSRLDSLQGAEREAEQVAAILKTKALIGSQATETAIVQRMQNAKIIHLATHGLLDDINGVGSPGAIVLAPSAQDDGFLTSSEIMEQYGLTDTTPLQAELVVLSACDTGRGEIKGEGVIGLSRSLIAAGVPSLVVSLWKVPDDATQELMVEFYTNLYERKLDKAQALRKAMLTMLDGGENPDPVDWAAFTVIGEAE